MMYEEYPALYCDANGTEQTIIRNDGVTLSMAVRGVEFAGRTFDDLEMVLPRNTADLPSNLRLYHHSDEVVVLCACVIDCDMGLPVVTPTADVQAKLHVRVELGAPTERGGFDQEYLHLTLDLEGRTYPGTGASGSFEYELQAIDRELPEGYYLKACINCAYSDYSVYGNEAFGSMICYRCCKKEYIQVRNKYEYMDVMERVGNQVDSVQETYLCPEFERRVPGTGYRG